MIFGAKTVLGAPLARLAGPVLVTAAIFPAWLLLKYVENPIRHAESRLGPPTRALEYGLARTMTGVLLGGSLVAAANASDRDMSNSRSVEAIRARSLRVSGAYLKGH